MINDLFVVTNMYTSMFIMKLNAKHWLEVVCRDAEWS